MRTEDPVAKGASADLQAAIDALAEHGIAGQLRERRVLFVALGKAASARRILSEQVPALSPISAEEAVFEYCPECGTYHGMGARRCPQCDAFVRP